MTYETVYLKSNAKLVGLNPVVAAATSVLIERCYSKGVPILITQGLRSIDYQNGLYAQGRSKPGSIVTNAKGGFSFHNFGLAVDFVILNPDGKTVSWDVKRDLDKDGQKDWWEVVEIAEAIGFEAGARWTKFLDMPHFQMTFGLSTARLRIGRRPTADVMRTAGLKIIQHLQSEWQNAKDKAEKDRIHALANTVRFASGIPIP